VKKNETDSKAQIIIITIARAYSPGFLVIFSFVESEQNYNLDVVLSAFCRGRGVEFWR
jgi:hypothetical protein